MRVKGGVVTRRRRKRILKKAKGYFGSKHALFKTAKEQVLRSERYSYIDRKKLKSNYRSLWIKRINAACRNNNINYSTFMSLLKKKNNIMNHKMLSEIAINDPETFSTLIDKLKENIK